MWDHRPGAVTKGFCIFAIFEPTFPTQQHLTMKFIILVALFVVAANAQDTSKWTPLVCNGATGTMGPNADRMKAIGACPPGDCAFFCQGKALGLLDSKGVPQSAIYDRWVTATFPERHHATGKAWFRDCMAKYGNKIDKADKTCKYAKSFGDCTWSVVPHLTCPKTG